MPKLIKAFADYLKIDAENWSTIKEIDRSALRYLWRRSNPREDAPGLARGRAAHSALFEPELFSDEYVIFTGKTRRGKEWDEFAEAHRDRTILKPEEYDKAWQCAASVRKHSEAAALLKDSKFEQSFTWKDKTTGLKCKCRVDAIRGGGTGSVLWDLKTTGNIDARIFGNLAARLLYFGQIAMYNDGAKHKGDVFIVATEAKPPFDVAVFQLSDDDLVCGRELYQGFLARVAECKASGVWPGRYPERQPLSLPKYVYGSDDEEGGSFEVLEAEG